jgi:hypothetical protein
MIRTFPLRNPWAPTTRFAEPAALFSVLFFTLFPVLAAVPSLAVAIDAPAGKTDSAASVSAFLSGAEKDEMLAAHRRQLRVGGYAGTPYVRDLEFKIRNEAFDVGRQRYTVQVSPKGLGEEGASRRALGTLSDRNEGTYESLRNRALKDRYGIVLDHVTGSSLAALYDGLAALEDERIRVLERQSVTDAFDLGDILRAEASQTRHRERAEEARAMAVQALARARALGGDSSMAGFDTTSLVSAVSVLSRLDDLEALGAFHATDGIPDSDNVHLRGARDDAATADAQYRLALSETRRFISFVEFGYDNGNRRNEIEDRDRGREYDLDRAYMVEVGFRLPWLGTDRSGVVRRLAERTNRQAELRRDREEIAADLREEIRTLRALGARYSALVARDFELDIPARLRRYAALGSADPLVILTLRQAQWENVLRREEVRFEILRRYIDAADLAGEVARRPARNLLSERLAALGE